ncbi:MAG: T9SS type A sorting domain-containing protein [Bacteroidia bacterium]
MKLNLFDIRTSKPKMNNMTSKFFTLLALTFLIVNISFGQLTTFYVQPWQTDNSYPSSGDSNYVAINTSVTPINKLLFYIGGTNSSPKRTTLFLKLAANLGYHVISVTYPNSTSIQTACGSSSDVNCYTNFRQEACYGTPVSSAISIDTLNSLNTRAVKLLQYLNITYPTQNWGQFVVGNFLDWSKIVTAGHSQGAGHALYFASLNNIDRCIMFSGANDFSNFYNAPPNWISGTFTTSKNKIFSFLHLQDDGVPYSSQIQVTQALGLWTGGDDSTLVDNLSIPYNNSHLLYTNETPQSMLITPYHNSTVIDMWTPLDSLNNPKFLNVWTYLLTTPITTSISETQSSEIKNLAYPNPFSNNIQFMDITGVEYFVLSNSIGQIIWTGKNIEQQDFSNLQNGLYYLTAFYYNRHQTLKLIKQ